MVMRLSSLFVRTLREDPSDAELPGHKALVRAGYVRRVAPGIYSWLPLGLRVLRKIEAIVREEMEAMGAQEMVFPALLPREPYEATGRWVEYGDNLFRLKDRKGNDMLLGPTHEELFTMTVGELYSSYKDLPLTLFQIQNKYRDEARPRGGVLRGREFVMKDSYSFAVDAPGLAEAYAAHRETYIRIFDRLGFSYVVVQADSGAMGGSASEEFLAVSPHGEDTFVRDEYGYAANVEAVQLVTPEPQEFPAEQPEIISTPAAGSIDDLVACLNADFGRSDDRTWAAADTLKTLLYMASFPDGSREPVAIALPGDRQIDEKRLEAALAPAECVPFTEVDFARFPQLVPGFIGPQILGTESETGIRLLLDATVGLGSVWVTGGNLADYHQVAVVAGRDFLADGHIQVAAVRAGDMALGAQGELRLDRGIEMGHIFQLGTKYAEALGLKVLNQNGKLVTVHMGSYGVGVTRAIGVIAEECVDEKGLSWPDEVAPFDVHVVVAGKKAEMVAAGEQLAEQIEAAGFSVLLDDRVKVSPGVKFKDAELLGMPRMVVIGRGLAAGLVEVGRRRTGERMEVPLSEVIAAL